MFFTSLENRPSFSFPRRRDHNNDANGQEAETITTITTITTTTTTTSSSRHDINDDDDVANERGGCVSPTIPASPPSSNRQMDGLEGGEGGEGEEEEDLYNEDSHHAHSLIGGKGGRRRRQQQRQQTKDDDELVEDNRQSRLERALYAEQTVQENLMNQGFDPKKTFLPKDQQVKLSDETNGQVTDGNDNDNSDSSESFDNNDNNDSNDDDDDDSGDNLESLTQAELDTLYANDMYELTLKEREQVLQEIHGIIASNSPTGIPQSPSSSPSLTTAAGGIDETTTTTTMTKRDIHKARCELQYQLAKLTKQPAKKGKKKRQQQQFSVEAYQMALQQDFQYVTSEKFQLQFLHADGFDHPEKAAIRIIQFFQIKLELFGKALLTKDITISDIYNLSKHDKKSLESGFFQLLPVRDVGGRAILCGQPPLLSYKHLDNVVSVWIYVYIKNWDRDHDVKRCLLTILSFLRSFFLPPPRSYTHRQGLSITWS